MIKTTEFAHSGDSHYVIAEHSLDICDCEIDDNVISFVDIKSYNTKRIIRRESLSEYMRILQEQASEDNKNVEIHDNANYSMLEVLTDDNVRMYFDIENIPKDNKEMINEIIYKIYETMKIDFKIKKEYEHYKDRDEYKRYALTFNPNSHHEGLSYHLYLPIRSTKKDIYNFIKLFNHCTDYKYVNMVDYRVYGKNRLFRTVGSRCPSKFKPFNPRNQEDYHKLIKGELADTVIQNYNKLDLIFECKITKELDDEFNDRINKMNNHFSEETKTKLITKNKYYNQRKFKPNFNNTIFNNTKFNNSSSPKQLDEFKDNLKSLSLKQLNEVKDKLESELSIKQLEEIRDKLKVMVSNNENKTKQLIRNQDNNKITILMFIVVIVLLIANLVSNLFK